MNPKRLVVSIAAFGAVAWVYANVPTKSLQVLSQTYTIDKVYKSMEGPASMQPIVLEPGKAPELVWITGFRTEIVGGDGKTPNSPEFMCHINLDANIGQHAQLFGWTKNVSPRLFTLSQAQFSVDLPRGFGMPVMSNESFQLATQVLNHNIQHPNNILVRHKVSIDFVRDADLKEPLKPVFSTNAFVMHLLEGKDGNFGMPPGEDGKHGPSCMPGVNAKAAGLLTYPDAYGRKFSGHWVVKPGRIVSHTNVTKVMNIPFDTTLHYINIHLHPFAEWIELTDSTTGKSVYRSRVRGPNHGIGLEHIDSFSSEKGIPVYKDHEYDLAVSYNNTSGIDQDAMATMFMYLLDKEFKKPAPAAPAATPALGATVPAPKTTGQPEVIFHTTLGDLTLKLFPEVAPKTVQHILELVKAGAYDSTHIYRVEPVFVAQTSTVLDRTIPITPAQQALIHTVPAEFSQIPHRRGTLSLARQDNDINSGESSFSILLGPAPHLDGKYTVFGEVVSGFDVLNKIEHVARDSHNVPLERLEIKKAEVLANPA